MPFDQTPDQVALLESEVFSLRGLISWLEHQPGDMDYDYRCAGTCLAHNYFEARGVKYGVSNGGFKIPRILKNGNPIEQIEWVSVVTPWTYGEALKRARTLLTEQE